VRNIKYYFLLNVILFFVGCSEGGIGGTGGVTAPPGGESTFGNANKGPYSDTASVTSRTITDNGSITPEVISGVMAGGIFGNYEVRTDANTTQLIEVSGSYFSENRGSIQDAAVTLRSVSLSGQFPANVNIATHLIHLRVINLISEGMQATTAIDTAEDELLLALSGLISVPSDATDFSNLVLINAQPGSLNQEGNAWLLALSSLLEKSAMLASERSGIGVEQEITNKLESIASDLEPDGILANQTLDDLVDARVQINPDEIHRNLLFLDNSLRRDLLVASGEPAGSLTEYACGVFQDEILCANLGTDAASAAGFVLSSPIVEEGVTLIRIPLEDIIADMNLFIDTDGDGTLNSSDVDDDDDGIPDATDAAPYDGDAG
jgi:hypothetical protein